MTLNEKAPTGWAPWADVLGLCRSKITSPGDLIAALPTGAMCCFGRFGGVLFVRASSDTWSQIEDALGMGLPAPRGRAQSFVDEDELAEIEAYRHVARRERKAVAA